MNTEKMRSHYPPQQNFKRRSAVRLKPLCRFALIHFVIWTMVSVPAFASVVPKNSQADISGGPEAADRFVPGFGKPVGEVTLSVGKVIITHSHNPQKFLVQKGLPLFNGDTIETGKKGKVRFTLHDGSSITLSSSTTLVINKSIYKPEQKRRFSFLKMIIGKARFFVTKLFKFREKAFKVKTSTFVAGVRGSEFIIIAREKTADLTALKKTAVVVTGLAAPEKSVIVRDFQRTVVPQGKPPGRPINVPMEEIQQLEKQFDLPEEKGTGRPKDDAGDKTGGKDQQKGNGAGKPDILIPGSALIQPDTTVEPDRYGMPEGRLFPEREETLFEDNQRDQDEQIAAETAQEERVEEDEIPEGENLPDMPDTPE